MVRKKSNDEKEQNPSQETLDTAKDSTFTEPPNPLSPQSSIDDLKKKFQHLKTLNSLLVKEVFESRQQIESLVQDKVALETDLSEKKASFELQNETISVYVENQMKELDAQRENVIGVLKKKVNELMGSLENERKDFELQINEGRLMREKLKEMESSERNLVEKIGEMEMECDCLVAKKDELEKVRISMVKDKDLLEKNMKCKAEEVEHLRRENEKIEIEKNEQRLKIDEMEKEMIGMNEVILSLRKEDGISRSKILELEKDYDEAMDREAEKAIKIGALVEEKRAIERVFKNKETMARDLEQKVKFMEISMVETEKKRSFWIMVSWITTLFAAVCMAYAATGH